MYTPVLLFTQPNVAPDPVWLTAYGLAEYRVMVGAETWVIKPGEPHEALENWLATEGFSGLAIVTAYNPGSVCLEEAENLCRHAELEQVIRLHGWIFGAALNQSADGSWPEPGFWIAGISREDAVSLGLQFGQNAVVWVG